MNISDLPKAFANIDIEDLEYVERDLRFNELASLALLLYGEEKTTAEFALQKLLVISNALSSNPASATVVENSRLLPLKHFAQVVPLNLLRTYASSINKTSWRESIVEALAILGCRLILRKLGFKWEVVYQHYLPNVRELSVHLHPLIKALYKVCENLTSAQAGHLILFMDEHYKSPQEHFRFYNSECLEVFLLDWITRRIISVGSRESCRGANLQVLFEYFKLNELEDVKEILIETLKYNFANEVNDGQQVASSITSMPEKKDNDISANTQSNQYTAIQNGNVPDLSDCYKVSYENAGIVLIINEKVFHEETDAELQHLLPKPKLTERRGTDVDREKLKETFVAYGYKPFIFENLKHFEMLNTIGEMAKRSVLYDSFIVCILSHGFDGYVYGSNSIPVAIAEIEDKFKEDDLKNKPKLLIIQACQTNNGEAKETCRKKKSAYECVDILKAMSTVSGFPSLRHTREGSWFIQSLCSGITSLAHKKHLCDILTKVTCDVSYRRGAKEDEIMIPQITSTLRHDFFLPVMK